MADDTAAKLMKWPSLHGERISPKDGAAPYTIMRGSLRECIEVLRNKSESSHHLYEIHMSDGAVLSAADALGLVGSRHPPPEDEYGGGDIVSLEREASTDDDQPLE